MESRLRIRFNSEERSLWLDELAALLAAIEESASLNRAAERLGMPYRRAWQILQDAAKLFGSPLTSTETGGVAGGGSTLTPRARALRKLLGQLHRRIDTEGERLRLLPGETTDTPEVSELPPEPDLILASSTEPVESGLLDRLEGVFFEETGIQIRHLSMGSSEALSLLVAGRVDAAITHAPALEEELCRRGLTENSRPFMMSHFAVVATKSDPADLEGLASDSLLDLFSRIEAAGTPFVSRADRSGTHLREVEVWKCIDGDTPNAPWYRTERPLGGTRQAIKTAMATGGYTMADRLAVRRVRGIRLFVAADEISRNIYSFVIPSVTTPGRPAADAFARWLATPQARRLVESAGVTAL